MGDLPRHRKVELIGVRPLIILRSSKNRTTSDEISLVRERIPTRESVVRIAERRSQRNARGGSLLIDVRKRKPNGERLEVRCSVPFVAGNTAVKYASRSANCRAPIAEWIPRNTNPR